MSAPAASVAIQNPYPGLRPFEVEEFESFFGRDRQIDELLGRLRARRFVAVVGLSGSGKSSFDSPRPRTQGEPAPRGGPV